MDFKRKVQKKRYKFKLLELSMQDHQVIELFFESNCIIDVARPVFTRTSLC